MPTLLSLCLGSPLTEGLEGRPTGSRSPDARPQQLSSPAGACIDDTILSKQGVENFAKLPSLEATQGQVVGALALPSSQTSSLLQHGSAHLTALLEQHIRRLQEGETGSAAQPAPAPSSGTR